MSQVFAPGCALMLHKPALANKLLEWLNGGAERVPEHLTCCRHEPGLPAGTRIINVCAGCDRRYRELYPGISTISLWEVLADSTFPFPDYGGASMAVLDACPTRTEAIELGYKIGTYPTGMLSPSAAGIKAGLAALAAGEAESKQGLPPAELRGLLGYADYDTHAKQFIVGG